MRPECCSWAAPSLTGSSCRQTSPVPAFYEKIFGWKIRHVPEMNGPQVDTDVHEASTLHIIQKGVKR
jgi:hypothetical protein